MKSMVPSDLKANNRRVVFETLYREGSLSRTELSRQTHISLPTVFKIVEEFAQKGIVIPTGELHAALGRKPLHLRFNPDCSYVAGVELEGSRMRIGLFNLAGELRANMSQPLPTDLLGGMGEIISSSVEQLTARIGTPLGRIIALGIGVPGVVDHRRAMVQFAPLIGITEPCSLAEMLGHIERRTGLKALLENDANAAAYGELIVRHMQRDASMLYMELGTGLGGGLILDGKLRRGARNLVGELGYWQGGTSRRVTVAQLGELESYVNLPALETRFGYAPGGTASGEMIHYLMEQLLTPVANIVNLLDMDMVVLGGIVFEDIAPAFVPEFAKLLSQMCLSAVDVQGARAILPGSMGAAMLAFSARLDAWLSADGQ